MLGAGGRQKLSNDSKGSHSLYRTVSPCLIERWLPSQTMISFRIHCRCVCLVSMKLLSVVSLLQFSANLLSFSQLDLTTKSHRFRACTDGRRRSNVKRRANAVFGPVSSQSTQAYHSMQRGKLRWKDIWHYIWHFLKLHESSLSNSEVQCLIN